MPLLYSIQTLYFYTFSLQNCKMAGSHLHFEGTFGINSTSLTEAISNEEYALAESIIEATSDVSYLNDGPSEDIPLHMVLSNDQSSHHKRNFRLARILVQKGADPNLRIPFAEFERMSPSPFEELVVYYEVLRYFSTGIFHLLSEEMELFVARADVLEDFVKDTIDSDGNMCLPTKPDCEKLVQQLSELIDIFLESAGDPNVITTFRRKTLFHWAVEHDLTLAERFMKTCRVNINLCDVHGTSPVMDLILCNETHEVLSFYESMEEMAYISDLNCRNCIGETALFRSCFEGAAEIASKLYEDGAAFETSVCVSLVPGLYLTDCVHCANFIPHLLYYLPSPLLAPLLSDSTIRFHYSHVESTEPYFLDKAPHKHLTDKIILSSISPLVDMLHFKCLSSEKDIPSLKPLFDQLLSLLEHTNFNHLRDGRIQTQDLGSLMFGQLSAGLRQLCVRTIFDHVLMVSSIPAKSWPDFVQNDFCIGGCKGGMKLSYLTQLIELLQLPQSFRIFLEIEAAKYQLCKLVMCFQCLECQQGCSESDITADHDSSGVDSDNVSSDYDTSMYSSDMLSEESFDEVDELSEELSFDSEFDEEEEEEEEEEGSEASGDSEDEVHPRRKVKSEYKRLSSSSENIRVIVESLCEDVAENMAQEHHESEISGSRETGGRHRVNLSSNSCESQSSSSESEVKLSPKESLSDSP